MNLRTANIAVAVVQALLSLGMVLWWLLGNVDSGGVPLGAPLGQVVAMLAVFSAITCIFHVSYAMGTFGYYRHVEAGRNWMRWLEYSITASIMIWVIAASSGVGDSTLRATITILTAMCMILGGLSDLGGLDRGCLRWMVALAWVSMLAAYGLVIWQFYETREGSPVPIPGFVYGIVWAMFGMYMSFGVIHASHLYAGKGDAGTNRKYEMVYTADSALSKTLLVGLLFGGIVARTGQ